MGTFDPTAGGLALTQHRLQELDRQLRLVWLRRAGLHITLREYERADARIAAAVRLAIAQARTPSGELLYPTDAARTAAFTIAGDNQLAWHALGALTQHALRRLDVANAELRALCSERTNVRLVLRLALQGTKSAGAWNHETASGVLEGGA